MAREAVVAEREIIKLPALLREIGLPRAIRNVLARAATEERAASPGRIFRFDFHWTTEGWRISEANSDVPGGFTEASSFTRAMCRQYPDTVVAGDPARAWTNALVKQLPERPTIALLSAAGFMEDQQVTAYLAQRLSEFGAETLLARPGDLRWASGRATVFGRSIDAIVRFFQGEWLAGLPRRSGWRHLVAGGPTPVVNPGFALITESKRFPLVWDRLGVDLPTWRRLLPETCDARMVNWDHPKGWVLKRAFCNTGDAVFSPDWLPPAQWREALRHARWKPREWAAQRRFTPIAAFTGGGLMYPCLGVYTVDGKAAGMYGRLATRCIVDHSAIDVAVLVEK